MEASQPSPEEIRQATEVSTAAAAAVAESVEAGETPEQARERGRAAASGAAREQKLELSDEDIGRIVDQLIEKLHELGAFQPGPAAAETSPPPEVVAEAAAEVAERQEPAKKTFAERFAGQ